METKEAEWKPMKGFYKFENKGDEIKGIYWGSKKRTINGKDTTIHIIETKHDIINIFGNSVLNDKISLVPIGRMVKIVLTKLSDENNKNYKDFMLYWG